MTAIARILTSRYVHTAVLSAATSFLLATFASAQTYSYAPTSTYPAPIFERVMPRYEPVVAAPAPIEADEPAEIAPEKRRAVVNYATTEAPGTIIVDTPHTYLYFVLGGGKAVRYGIGVGRDGFRWSGIKSIERKTEWPDWTPPAEMLERQPYLPRFMAGGPGNPLGARALYLSGSLYRIHGTNAPSTIGGRVSSGCIRMLNEDVIDLYQRVSLGTKVVVLPDHSAPRVAAKPVAAPRAQTASRSRSAIY